MITVKRYTKRTLIAALSLAALLKLPTLVGAEEPIIEFRGMPQRVTSVGCQKTSDKAISTEKAEEFICLIHKIDGRYYWASRENRELLKVQSGCFINYIAVGEGGYVKVINPAQRSAVAFLGESEVKYDYVEHLLAFGLSSIAYYGKQSE
jgi:hypothetical protein